MSMCSVLLAFLFTSSIQLIRGPSLGDTDSIICSLEFAMDD